jgi:IS30 family transposase
MSNYITYEERMEIENCLHNGKSFGQIAKELGKDRSTISREIRKHSVIERTGYGANGYNACTHREECTKVHVCSGDCHRQALKYCKLCNCCNDNCLEFEEQVCVTRFKPPYVCNSCSEKNRCTLEKTMYYAVKAHSTAQAHISESRRGILTSEQELNRLNAFVTPLILQGQSIHQIYINYADTLMCSEKTLYNYIDHGFFDARNIDLPRKVRYRPRKKKQEFKVDRGCYIGRSYTEYQQYLVKNPEVNTVQMDSVLGTVGGKVLLTIHFTDTNFMLAYLREANTSQSVIDVFDYLYLKLGRTLFLKFFPLVLTDRGSEFSNPRMIEMTPDGLKRTSVFYCDPGAPYQKGAIENNHELVRRILPKGHSFDKLTQADIDRMMNHINSYRRPKLGDKSPFEAFAFHHGTELFEKLGLAPVEPNCVILKPRLLKR